MASRTAAPCAPLCQGSAGMSRRRAPAPVPGGCREEPRGERDEVPGVQGCQPSAPAPKGLCYCPFPVLVMVLTAHMCLYTHAHVLTHTHTHTQTAFAKPAGNQEKHVCIPGHGKGCICVSRRLSFVSLPFPFLSLTFLLDRTPV